MEGCREPLMSHDYGLWEIAWPPPNLGKNRQLLTISIHPMLLKFQDLCIIYQLFNLLGASDFKFKMFFLPIDLLMEHIQEIRTLRKHLEEFITTNEKLRKQLEHQRSETDQGKEGLSQGKKRGLVGCCSVIFCLKRLSVNQTGWWNWLASGVLSCNRVLTVVVWIGILK